MLWDNGFYEKFIRIFNISTHINEINIPIKNLKNMELERDKIVNVKLVGEYYDTLYCDIFE